MPSENDEYAETRRIKRKYERALLSQEGVVGCGVGLDGRGHLGIVVYASREQRDIPPRLDDVHVFTEELLPDNEWTNAGHITCASVEELDVPTGWHRGRARASPNKVDAAVAKPDSMDFVVPEILGLGVPQGMSEACLGMRVRKSGRTTGVTAGIVMANDVSVFVNYSYGRTALFVEQIATTKMSEPGDSGSLLVDTDLAAVGLLFAQAGNRTFHNGIQNVFDALDLEIWMDKPDRELQAKIEETRLLYDAGKKRTEKWRPAPAGVSIGHYQLRGAGTLGCFVKDRKTGEVVILGNAHVLAPSTPPNVVSQ